MKLSFKNILSLICICLANYTIIIDTKPTAENPLRGNLFKLNSNATNKLRTIYTNYAIPGTLVRGNPKDSTDPERDSTNNNKDYFDQHNTDDAKEPQLSFVRASYKPYVYEIEAVLLENDTKPEKPITYVYDFDKEYNERKSNKSFRVGENRNINTTKGNRTVKEDDFLSINYTIRIDKNILQLLSQVLTDFVQKIFKKTLMNYITQNMNHTMTELRDKHKIKTFFNYAIDLKADKSESVSRKSDIKLSNGTVKSSGNYNPNIMEHNRDRDYHNYYEKMIPTTVSYPTDDTDNVKENGFLVPFEDLEYDSNSRRHQI